MPDELLCVGECPVCGPASEVLGLWSTGALLFWCPLCENATRRYSPSELHEIARLPREARAATREELKQQGVPPIAEASERARDELRRSLALLSE